MEVGDDVVPGWLQAGVAYDELQFAALMVESKGYLAMTSEEQSSLADQLRSAIRTVA